MIIIYVYYNTLAMTLSYNKYIYFEVFVCCQYFTMWLGCTSALYMSERATQWICSQALGWICASPKLQPKI